MGWMKTVGMTVLVVGVVILILSLGADLVGGVQGLGYWQKNGIIVGAIIAVVGLILALIGRRIDQH